MNLLARIWTSSVGKKYLMAITGALLVLFALGHLVGNLQIFLPPAQINRYAHLLKSNPGLLWLVRLGLLTVVTLHVVSALRLYLENKAARPVDYASGEPAYGSTYSSRTMVMSGLIIVSFVIYHLLHFTALVPAVNLTGVDFATLREPATGGPDVYAMMVLGFSRWYISLFYVIAIGLLCLHLSHGIPALFQSLGWRCQVAAAVVEKLAKLFAVLLFAGYVSIPVAVWRGHGQDYLKRVQAHGQAQPLPTSVEKPAAH